MVEFYHQNVYEIPWPAPLNEAAYHGVLGEIVKTIEPHSEADPPGILMSMVTMVGNTIGYKPHVKIEADRHGTRINCVLVGKTSKGRKGVAVGYASYTRSCLGPELTGNKAAGLSSGEGLIYHVRDPVVRRKSIKQNGRIVGYEEVVEDEGAFEKRLWVIADEFSSALRVMERAGNTLSPTIRSAWDTGDLQVLTKNSPMKATGAHISITAETTVEELTLRLTNAEVFNGFGNRFLWFCVKRSKSLPFGGNLNKDHIQSLMKKLKTAIEFASHVEEVIWAEETRPIWAQIYPRLSEGKPGLIGALTARAEAYVVRLACIYALLDKSSQIRPEHLNAAIAIWNYSEASVKYIFQDETGDPLANKILSFLRQNPHGSSRSEISSFLGRNISSHKIASALNFLHRLGHIHMTTITTDGRPREVWFSR